MSRHMATLGRKNLLLAGRNLQQNQAHRGAWGMVGGETDINND